MLLLYWWHSGAYKGHARALATAHCQSLNLQLLDQSMVICSIWPEKSAQGGFSLRRIYRFEFTSTGAQRYQGSLVLCAMKLRSIELEAYRIADPEQ